MKIMSENSEHLKEQVKKAEKMVKDGETETILIPLGDPVKLGGVPFTVGKVKGNQLTLIVGAGYKLDYDNARTRKKHNYKSPQQKVSENEES